MPSQEWHIDRMAFTYAMAFYTSNFMAVVGLGYIRASLARGPGNVKDIISQFLIYTYILLADALLLWRCYIIWSDVGIQVLVLPLLLFLSVVDLSILILARITTGAIWNTTNHAYIPAYTLLTVSFNVTATSLIAY
ncbi:hypothetical protein CC2G_004304 [Coprinopsis cinerea AmutBmut pab1-1]|nr:hypothetical protein CC2G_004304 [Coprinopsis cinerea AmutBmut pab1-1]